MSGLHFEKLREVIVVAPNIPREPRSCDNKDAVTKELDEVEHGEGRSILHIGKVTNQSGSLLDVLD